VTFRAVWPGALVALLGVLIVQFGTSAYYALFGEVNAVYGTLGVMLAVVFSQYLAAIAVVYGAHITAQAAQPSTSAAEGVAPGGPPPKRRPFGRVALDALRGLVVREHRPGR
jgi:uncharacterized BrkB/YihY/UPF0761 family membrane protein